jgi:two-component system, sensor histidine kinase and response regulator
MHPYLFRTTQKGIALRLEWDGAENDSEKICPKVQGDYLELRRMLTNLLGNSIKFTDSGSVDLHLIPFLSPSLANDLANDLDRSRNWLTLKVQDTGFGISEAEQATLFERFRKGTHKQSGSGLGLHLVSRIVQVHQGKIEVRSELEKGSLFTIYLPIV